MSKKKVLVFGGCRVGDAFCFKEHIRKHATEGKVDLVIGKYAEESWRWQLDHTDIGHLVDNVVVKREVRFPFCGMGDDTEAFFQAIQSIGSFDPEKYDLVQAFIPDMNFQSPMVLTDITLYPEDDLIGVQSRTVSSWKNQHSIEELKFPGKVISFETETTETDLVSGPRCVKFHGNLEEAIGQILKCRIFIGNASCLALISAQLGLPTITCHHSQESIDYAGGAWNGKSIDLLNPSSEVLQEAVDKAWELYGG